MLTFYKWYSYNLFVFLTLFTVCYAAEPNQFQIIANHPHEGIVLRDWPTDQLISAVEISHFGSQVAPSFGYTDLLHIRCRFKNANQLKIVGQPNIIPRSTIRISYTNLAEHMILPAGNAFLQIGKISFKEEGSGLPKYRVLNTRLVTLVQVANRVQKYEETSAILATGTKDNTKLLLATDFENKISIAVTGELVNYYDNGESDNKTGYPFKIARIFALNDNSMRVTITRDCDEQPRQTLKIGETFQHEHLAYKVTNIFLGDNSEIPPFVVLEPIFPEK